MQPEALGEWCLQRHHLRTCTHGRGASLPRIGRRARRPPQAGLEGSLLEGLRPSQHHEGGARAPCGGEFIVKTTQELQEARAIRGDCRPPDAAPHPGEDGGLRVCIDILGLKRAASQERFWPSRVGRCKGTPHSYVPMPFGLPSMASAYQHAMRRDLVAQEARYRVVLEGMETVFREPPEPPELLDA